VKLVRFGKCLLLVALILFSIIPLMAVDGSSAKSPVRVRDALTEFSWEPDVGENQPSNVSIIGEWDWGNHTDLSFDVSAGKWTTSIILAEGMYCYKFVIGENDYRFDNDNSYRGYCGNYENSIVRVEDTSKPALSLDSFSINTDGLDATILYWAGSNQANPNTINATLMHDFTDATITGIWDASNWKFSLDIENLADGKYTLKVAGSDINNDEAEELLLPFWIGEQSNFIWDDALIYMVMTDRFVDGNAANNPVATSAAQGADWQGGDFAGITQMIQSGYFNDLGVNALWLTPFNTAANGTGIAGDGQHEVSAYHGYWPIEPRGVDARLGTEAELEELISTAHEHGIRVMSDLVVNHVHEDHPYYSNNPDWFNQGCLCGAQNCGWTEHRLDCQFRSYMPDINWKNRDASEQMIADGLWWLERFDLDGARIDAVKHVDDLAIYNFGTQVEERFESMGTDYYLKGETAMGWAGHSLVDNQDEYSMINRYMSEQGLDGQADFVLYHAVVDNVFTSGNMDYAHLDYWTARSQDQYSNDSTMVPFVGSHDVPRFTSRADSGTNDEWNQWQEEGLPGQPGNDLPYQAALQAYAWLLTTPGAPLIYQGDEYGEFGGADPDNRHMWRNNSNINSREFALMENISAIAQLRKDSDALRRGSYESLTNSTDTIAWSMTTSSNQVVVAMNRGGNSAGFDLELNWLANDSLNGIVMDENHSFTLGPHAVAIFLQPHDNNSSPIQGCTNSSATNYNPLAEVDDGSCQYPSPPVEGCTNSSATNYNPLAEVDDGSCEYDPEPCEDDDDDGVCNDDDSCPVTPFWFTAVDDEGCIIIYDGDEDGIPDGEDGCPNTPFENRSMVGYDGCIPDDLDNDGVPNWQDECPSHFGYSEHLGCAECFPGELNIPCPCGSSVGWEGMCICACNDEGILEGHMDNGTFGTPHIGNESSNQENNTNSDNDTGENNQDSTTETGGVGRANFVVYALLIILVLAIIGFVMMSIRRP